MPTIHHDHSDDTGHSKLYEGRRYPLDYLIGVLRDAEEAERAARSLYDAGLTELVVVEGPLAMEMLEASERTANPLTRAWHRLSLYLSGENDLRTAALEALDQGHALLMVYASGKAREDQAERILQAYGARALAYFGRWTITELSH